ncbi:MAG: hypothetical protein B5M52_07905 [Helicobacteraceae bacterium 4484_230]|nr:MAG: hypothetical protein B5M52_07905 [Helicobacteraceae bacterium 4484_230]
MRYCFAAILTMLIFGGCVSSTPAPKKTVVKQEVLPGWVLHPQSGGALRAVGSSPVNFQGTYIQRLEAMADARDKLSHAIKVYITSVFESRLEANGNELTHESRKSITELSNIIMKESYQVDAYVANDGRLYVLVEASDSTIAPLLKGVKNTAEPLKAFKTTPYNPQALRESRCYDTDTLNSINTVSRLYRGRPVWFYRPNQNGTIGSIGIAEKEEGGSYLRQKHTAESLARSDLAKRMRIKIDSSHKMTKILQHGELGSLLDKEMHTKSISKVMHTEIKDIWMDPKNCELYVWMVKK